MTVYSTAFPRYYEATRTGALLREATRGGSEMFNRLTGDWQPDHKIDEWKIGKEFDLEPLAELEVRRRWPEAFAC